MPKSKQQKRINLRDVARAAGVSAATVSRVLNSPDAVTPDTRARVEAAIADLRFVPSAAARAINSGRTRFVGALVPTLDNAIFARFLATVEQRLAEERLSLVVATTNDSMAVEAQKAQTLVDIGAEGLIVSGVTHDASLFDLVERYRLPTIATSYFDPDCFLPTIGYDNAGSARLAMDHLLDLNHRRIAVLHGPAESNDRTRARLSGLAPPPDVRLQYFEVDIALTSTSHVVEALLAADERPTAVLCLSDVLAMGVLFELQRKGISVPEQISVVGIDDLPAAEHVFPALTTVHLPVARMGSYAAQALAKWVETKEAPSALLLESRLIARDSSARVTR